MTDTTPLCAEGVENMEDREAINLIRAALAHQGRNCECCPVKKINDQLLTALLSVRNTVENQLGILK